MKKGFTRIARIDTDGHIAERGMRSAEWREASRVWLSGMVEPTTGLIEDLTTSKNGPAREALLAEKRKEISEIAPVLISTSVLGIGFYGFACLAPRRKWGWGFGMAAIIGSIFPFCVTWIGIGPLLILWCKPQVKSYYANAP
jgi:hypothetical protein